MTMQWPWWSRWLVILLVLSSAACKTSIYLYAEPTGVGRHKWNEKIQHFGDDHPGDSLTFLVSDGLDVFNCIPIERQELSAYFNAHEDLTALYPGIKVASVTYFYFYKGMDAELAGSDVEYLSEEYDPSSKLDAGSTTHRRLITELVHAQGRPNSGPWPLPAITISTLDNSDVLRTPARQERHTWCAPEDEHASPDCDTTVISEYSPESGIGHILTLHGAARKFPAIYQRFAPIPYTLYQAIYNTSRYWDDTAQPSSCEGAVARDIHEVEPAMPLTPVPQTSSTTTTSSQAPIEKVEMQVDQTYSERILNGIAQGAQQLREARPYGMTLHQYIVEMTRGSVEEYSRDASPTQRSYWVGYQRGVRMAYCQRLCASPEYHDRMLQLATSKDEYVHEEGLGYRAGLSAPHEPTPKSSEREQ